MTPLSTTLFVLLFLFREKMRGGDESSEDRKDTQGPYRTPHLISTESFNFRKHNPSPKGQGLQNP